MLQKHLLKKQIIPKPTFFPQSSTIAKLLSLPRVRGFEIEADYNVFCQLLFFQASSGLPASSVSPRHPLLPTVSFGSSLGNDNFSVYHLSLLSYVKLQNDISFLLISPKGKQCITQEFCVKSWYVWYANRSLFLLCGNETLSLWLLLFRLWNASPITLHLCPWQLPQAHVASQMLFVLLKFFCVQNNHRFREIIAVSSVLEWGHG